MWPSPKARLELVPPLRTRLVGRCRSFLSGFGSVFGQIYAVPKKEIRNYYINSGGGAAEECILGLESIVFHELAFAVYCY